LYAKTKQSAAQPWRVPRPSCRHHDCLTGQIRAKTLADNHLQQIGFQLMIVHDFAASIPVRPGLLNLVLNLRPTSLFSPALAPASSSVSRLCRDSPPGTGLARIPALARTRRQGLIPPQAATGPGNAQGNVVPEARLELASLAAEDFESPASTIPPLGPPGFGLEPVRGGVNAGPEPGQRSSVWNVSQSAICPD
jgi:hypothetical protein